MEVETKFLRLFKPVALGDRIDGWRVCWIGGWDKCRAQMSSDVRNLEKYRQALITQATETKLLNLLVPHLKHRDRTTARSP